MRHASAPRFIDQRRRLNEPQGAIHEVGFRRFTVHKLPKMNRNHFKFVIERGQHGQFTKTWVFISHSHVEFNVDAMDKFLKFIFAMTRAEAMHHYPHVDGQLSLGLFKQMVSDFVVLGRKVGGQLVDFSRTGMIKNVSEFKEYIYS